MLKMHMGKGREGRIIFLALKKPAPFLEILLKLVVYSTTSLPVFLILHSNKTSLG